MARIHSPKNISILTEKFSPKEYMPLLGQFGVINEKGQYLHWDQFQWRVQKGIHPELAWIATKVARSTISKPLKILKAVDINQHFQYCIPDSLFAKLHYVDKLMGGGSAIGDSPFSTDRAKDNYLIKSLMMEEAITSSQLEGASTTRKVAKEMLKTQRRPKDKSETMIFNNFLLMKKAVEKRDEPLSIDLILELHAIATHDAIDNGAVSGELRDNDDVTVMNIYNEVAHTPPNASSLVDRLQDLCVFANQCDEHSDSTHFIHPLVKAIILHFMMGYIHPFGDGNGRTARALFYWFMLKSGYWLFEYVSISKLIQEKRSDYDTAYIYTETDDLDLTYFIYHQVDVVTKAIDSLQAYIEKKKMDFYQFSEWIEKSSISKTLRRGQIEILKEAMKQPGKIFTVKAIAFELDINENTARTYLNKLVDVGLLMLSKQKSDKTLMYVAPADLQTRLKL